MPDILYKESLHYRLSEETAGEIGRLHEQIITRFGKKGYKAGIYFTDDGEMAELNSTYRGKQGATDVLSFPLEDDEAESLGEIIISVETAARQGEQGTEREILELFVHGMLHLLGFDHETDDCFKEMNGYEREFLSSDE